MLLTGFQVGVQHQVAVSSVKLPVHARFHVSQLQVLDPPHLQTTTGSHNQHRLDEKAVSSLCGCFLLLFFFGGGGCRSHLYIAGSIVHHALPRCQFRLRMELHGSDLRLVDLS